MARNDIGNLNVRVTADTREFVNGMANVQRRTEQTTAVLQKSRQAFSGLGAAMRMPRLARGAALGGAASGVASALGIGALSGGAVGIAATGTFLVVDGLIQRSRRLNELATERRQIELDIAKAQREQTEAAQALANTIRAEFSGSGSETANRLAMDQKNAERIQLLQSEIAALYAGRAGASGFEWQQTERRIQELRNAISQQQTVRFGERPGYPGARALAERRLEGWTQGIPELARRAGLPGLDQFRVVFDKVSEGVQAQVRGASAVEAMQQASRESMAVVRQYLDEWKRENQRSSDMLATTVGRISSQITQLTYRSD